MFCRRAKLLANTRGKKQDGPKMKSLYVKTDTNQQQSDCSLELQHMKKETENDYYTGNR